MTRKKKKEKPEGQVSPPPVAELAEAKDLKQIAIDIVEQKIFLSNYVKPDTLLPEIFMPVAVGAFKGITKEEAENIACLYEYYDKAGPTSINGYPVFMSFSILTKEEGRIVDQHIEAYNKLKEQFKNS